MRYGRSGDDGANRYDWREHCNCGEMGIKGVGIGESDSIRRAAEQLDAAVDQAVNKTL